MVKNRYFIGSKNRAAVLIRVFLAFLFVFAVAFFLWSMMKYNKIIEDKNKNTEYIRNLTDEIEELQYLVDAPLDDAYKIRIAREKLGMCFPDEIVFYTEALRKAQKHTAHVF